jgi:hypothetical protein
MRPGHRVPVHHASMEPALGAKQRIFIIHGRNQRAVEELSKFLLAIGVEPWPFETVSASLGGNPFIDQVVRAGIDGSAAIIALFTPDERAKLRYDYELPTDKPRDRLRWQCRANVLYETGLAFATAGAAERTLIVVAGPVDLPTDFDGRHLLRLSNEPAPRRRLRQHFVEAGCVLADDPREAFLDPKHGNFDDDVIVGAAIAAQNPMGLDPGWRSHGGRSPSQQAGLAARALAAVRCSATRGSRDVSEDGAE